MASRCSPIRSSNSSGSTDGGGFTLALEYFRHWTGEISMQWDSGAPVVPDVYTDALPALLGPARRPDAPVTAREEDLAASVQQVFEQSAFHVLRGVHQRVPIDTLCLAGGCAMNSVANGKIRANTPFRSVFIQPAAGDNGTALGAALAAWHGSGERPISARMEHAYWGTQYDDATIGAVIRASGVERPVPLAARSRRSGAVPRDRRPPRGRQHRRAGFRAGWSGARARSAIAASSRIPGAPTCAT